MEEGQREIIDQFSIELKSDVIPTETLPYLSCLTEDDREVIQCRQDREGPRAAVPFLLDRLKKRSGSFEQFLYALESTGCGHLKKLLIKVYTTGVRQTTPTLETSRQLSLPSQETDYSEFDMLVCYGQKDKEVAFEMRERMKEYDLRVCIDEEDFILGKAIAENICDFIRCCKTIVFLLTKDFLEKKWSYLEMQHALLDFLEKKTSPQKKKIIPVLLKECKIPNALRPYTALNFQDSRDWKRLVAAVREDKGSDNDVPTSDNVQETVGPTKLVESSD